jgi:hypothetical protein
MVDRVFVLNALLGAEIIWPPRYLSRFNGRLSDRGVLYITTVRPTCCGTTWTVLYNSKLEQAGARAVIVLQERLSHARCSFI